MLQKRLIINIEHSRVIIDEEDLAKVIGINWKIKNVKLKSGYNYYVWNTENKKPIYLHRIIMGCPKGKEIDHINGNGLDNRKSNLRICNRQQNNLNKKKTSGCIGSKYKGVFKNGNSWVAYISIDGKRKHIGSYGTEFRAAMAYNRYASEFHGEFANLNDI